jgi:peptidoglycan hydrolase-like protein with peptidoglycan-binding domain
MTRLSTMAIAAALIAACNQQDRRDVGGAASEARANVDTALSGVGAEVDTAIGGAADRVGARTDTSKPIDGEEALTPARRAGTTFDLSGLSADQVKQLQTALNNNGCNAGPVDGVVGPRTQQGIACAMRKHNVQGQDLNALYRSLNLDFGG